MNCSTGVADFTQRNQKPFYIHGCRQNQRHQYALREQTVDFKEISILNVAMTSLCKQLQDFFVRMSSEHSVKPEKPHPAETTSPASSISSSIAKLQLDQLKFSGLATDWHNFYALFSVAMKTRGAGLSDPERCCFSSSPCPLLKQRK